MAGRIFVTGGSGFVGTAVIDELLSRGYGVTALVHTRPIKNASAQSIQGSLFDVASLERAMQGCSAVIHLVGIIMENRRRGVTFQRMHYEATRNVVDAAKHEGIRRYVHMSALGTRADAVSNYHKTKYAAEQYVMKSGLDWTIIRPSLIHGPNGEFMKMLAKWSRGKAAPFLFMPYFGAGIFGRGGAGNLQPVAVTDVARAFVDALSNPKTVGEIYPLAGPAQYTWPELHHLASEAIVGRKRASVAVPAWYAKLLTHVAPARMLPFNHDQVVMSQEDNTTDISKFVDDFGWSPSPFEPALNSYASQL